jgi:hypothetical protein
MVDVVRRDDDADGDDRADVIDVADAVDVEVASGKSATVGDVAKDVAVDEVTTAVRPEVIGSGSRRTPPTLLLRWTLPNAMSIPPRRPKKDERDANAWGVNSKDPKQIGSSKIGDDEADDENAGEDVADTIGTADDVLRTSRFPTDGANWQGGSSAIPTMRGLGLTKSYRLAEDIGYQTNRRQDLPMFGDLDEVKPLLLLV